MPAPADHEEALVREAWGSLYREHLAATRFVTRDHFQRERDARREATRDILEIAARVAMGKLPVMAAADCGEPVSAGEGEGEQGAGEPRDSALQI